MIPVKEHKAVFFKSDLSPENNYSPPGNSAKPGNKEPSVFYLLFKAAPKVKLVNWISFFRVMAFPVMIILILHDQITVFKWLLLITFLTDAADGFLARKLKATTTNGAKLDSIGDDLTIAAGLAGLLYYHLSFVFEQIIIIGILFALFFIQIGFALGRYGRLTSFHTYLAKIAAVSQGVFFCSIFFFGFPSVILFYLTSAITAAELLEEIVIVMVLPKWKTNVRGLYWVNKMMNSLKSKRKRRIRIQDL